MICQLYSSKCGIVSYRLVCFVRPSSDRYSQDASSTPRRLLYMRKLHLIKCWKQKRLAFTFCSVCSLHKHFIGFIVSYQIGSNLVGSLLVSKGKSVHMKKSMSFSKAFQEPVGIYTIRRSYMKCDRSTNYKPFMSNQELYVSSVQSRGCLSLLHTNNNRAGLSPIGLMNLYTWAFGLTSCRISICLKRICDPTLNTIRGLFVCT
jgi:hypothetical protein